MTTRLAGTATHFLPFNKGCGGGAGNPPDPAGRTYRTAYLWEEVLQRDSLTGEEGQLRVIAELLEVLGPVDSHPEGLLLGGDDLT